MSMTRRSIFVVALLTTALVAIIAMKQWTLNTGIPVLLETQPVDPRSLFRGDYVRLSYTISDLRLDKLTGDDAFERLDGVYVVLEQGKTYWKPVSVHRRWPELRPGQVAIKGKVQYLDNRSYRPPRSGRRQPATTMHVRYGIENYFVPEGSGRELERRGTANKVDMLVAVDRYGNAGIKAVLVNGQEKYRERLF